VVHASTTAIPHRAGAPTTIRPVAACLLAGGLLAIWWAEVIKGWPVAMCSWAWGE
jgi:hypothetical protein